MDSVPLDEIRRDRLDRKYRASDNRYVVEFSPAARSEYFFQKKPGEDEIDASVHAGFEKTLMLPPEKRTGNIDSYKHSVYPLLNGWRLRVEFGKAVYSNITITPEPFNADDWRAL